MYNTGMQGPSPFHNDPNPFASFLFGFPVIGKNSGPSEPGDVSDELEEDFSDTQILNQKLDLILARLSKLESMGMTGKISGSIL